MSPVPGPARPYAPPTLRTHEAAPAAVLLACTGPGPSVDCAPIVGFPCCKNNVSQCDKCRP